MKGFPKLIYVSWNEQDEPFLETYQSIEEHASVGDSVRVAVYELSETGWVDASAVMRSVIKKRRPKA